MSALHNKRILLGVTGGIAAYKAAELVRHLRRLEAEVRVVMTQAATAFVTPLTFQVLSGNPAHLDLLDVAEESRIGHIELARWADLILIAPATADFMARLRVGMADDLLSTLCLATTVPIYLAPAMNQAMWQHPATRENTELLRKRGLRLLGPAEGAQACGETGPGRMLEPEAMIESLCSGMNQSRLAGVRILISAGPTREPLDPVRYLTNRSSGKMGYALAQAAVAEGAHVVLVSGPTALPEPGVQEFVRVETAGDMYAAVMERVDTVDIYIGTAAVADYAPLPASGKIKKNADELVLTLSKTADVLAAVAGHPSHPFTVGFAAETSQLEAYARQKLTAKSLDMVAANQVGEGLGFDVDQNALYVCWSGGEVNLPCTSKTLLAEQLLTLITDRYHAKHPAQNS